MAKLTTKARQSLPSKSFALPGKGTGKSGKGPGSYPIPDPSHARNALARVSQHGTPSEKATVRAKVKAKYPSIGKKQFGTVAAAPGAPRVKMPKAPGLVGAPRPFKPKPFGIKAPGRLSSTAGMKKGGVVAGVHATQMKSFPKPHTYQHGGVVKGSSGDRSPATVGKMSNAGGFAGLGIRR